MIRVIVVIKDGLVQSVFCDQKLVDVEVLDKDDHEVTDELEMEHRGRRPRLERECRKLYEVY